MARGPLGLSSSLWTAGERGTKGMEGAVPVLDGTAQPPALTAEAVDKRPTPTNATRAKNGPLRTTRKMFIFSPFRIESIRLPFAGTGFCGFATKVNSPRIPVISPGMLLIVNALEFSIPHLIAVLHSLTVLRSLRK